MVIADWLGENNNLGIDIWKKKYCYNNETFDEWLNRVSNNNKNVRELILNKKFLFGGRILANRGLNKLGKKVTYSNCYVITQPEDSIESIFECATKLARTYSYGGGCGIDISNLAPRGAKVNNTAEQTTGAVSFMDLYSLVTGLIGQSGRRGALMLSLDCNHPDLEEFIDIKKDLNKITSANISIRFDNDFMRAVENNTEYTLSFTRQETGETIEKVINAREIFKKLSDANWSMGEPGCLFWDRISSYNLLQNTPNFTYAGTNPCAEEPLPAGGSCLLGSINLAEFVVNPFEKNSLFDFDEFNKAVKIAVRALNEVLDEGLELHPLEEQRKSVRDWRQIGLGVMGIADMLIKLGIQYGSEESFSLCNDIGDSLAATAIEESILLADEYGAFPECNIEQIVSTDFYRNHASGINQKKPKGLRNSQLLTIAPTGTLSTMLGISGGIEPIFANSYTRTTKSLHGEDVDYKVYTPIVEEYMKRFDIQDEKDLPDFFVTAQDIHYSNRIEMQAVWQFHIDASISSTVNLPNSATKEDVFQLYLDAWASGLKGITIFRDGCERVAILNTTKEEVKDFNSAELKRGQIIPTDDGLIGRKRKLMTGCGSLHCTAFFDPTSKELREIYLSKGSTGGCNNFMIGLSRMISLSARAGVGIDDIINQLDSCGVCPSYATRRATKNDTSPGSCCPVAIGKALKEMHDELVGAQEQTVTTNNPKCPKCKNDLIHEGGCNICKNCGWSKCD